MRTLGAAAGIGGVIFQLATGGGSIAAALKDWEAAIDQLIAAQPTMRSAPDENQTKRHPRATEIDAEIDAALGEATPTPDDNAWSARSAGLL